MNGFRYAARKGWLAALTRDAIATADWFGDRDSHTRGVPVPAKNAGRPFSPADLSRREKGLLFFFWTVVASRSQAMSAGKN